MFRVSKYLSKLIIVTLIMTMVITSFNAVAFANDDVNTDSVQEEQAASQVFMFEINGQKLDSEITYYINLDDTITDSKGDAIDNVIDENGNLLDADGAVCNAVINNDGTILMGDNAPVEFDIVYLADAAGNVVAENVFAAVDGVLLGRFTDMTVEEVMADQASAEVKKDESETFEVSEPETQSVDSAVTEAENSTNAGDSQNATEEPETSSGVSMENDAEAPIVVKAQATATTGWKTINGYKYYYYTSTKYYVNVFVDIDGVLYAFDEKGHLVINSLIEDDDKNLYAAGSTGAIQKGVFKLGSNYYFANLTTYKIKTKVGFFMYKTGKYYVKPDHTLAYNEKIKASGKTYIAGSTAKILKGVFKFGKYYYFSSAESGAVKTTKGWAEADGKKYYVNKYAHLLTDVFMQEGDTTYYFLKNGAAASGVFKAANKYYYYAIPENNHIKVKKAMVTWKGRKYYVRDGGKLYSNKRFTIGGKEYIAKTGGMIGKGVFTWKNNYYYADKYSVLRTSSGFITVNGKKRYIKNGGAIAKDERINVGGVEYIATEKGVIGCDIFTWNDVKYCSESDGTAITKSGFRTIGDQTVFVFSSGKVAINVSFTYQKVFYVADENGVCTATIDRAESILNIARGEIGTKTGKKYWDANFGGAISFKNGDSTPWCGCFVVWCYRQAGMGKYINNVTNVAYVPSYYSYAKANNKFVKRSSGAKPADLVLFDYNLNGTPDHVGMVESATSTTVTTIEGNVGSTKNGEVKRKYYDDDCKYIFGYVRLLP